MQVTDFTAWDREQVVVQASAELAGVVRPLLLAAFPEHEIYETELIGLPVFLTNPALNADQRAHLGSFLAELVARPEWVQRAAIMREVTDSAGERFDIRVPITPTATPEIGVYGPFASTNEATDWVREHAPYQLESDIFSTPVGVVVELFRLT